MIEEPRPLDWYALSVRPQYEKVVQRNLNAKGYETFLPLAKRLQRKFNREMEVEVPLFQGYVLIRLDPLYRLPVLKVPAVDHIVSIDRCPCPIPDEEVETVRAVVDSTLEYGPWPYVEAGQRVRVRFGSLDGLEGFVVDCRGTQKLVISLNLLQRSVAVEIDRAWVEPLPTSELRPIPIGAA
jgi:transcription antitermination factor NusG